MALLFTNRKDGPQEAQSRRAERKLSFPGAARSQVYAGCVNLPASASPESTKPLSGITGFRALGLAGLAPE
jgi:hypothetical protein